MAYTKKEVLELAITVLADNEEAVEKLNGMIAQLGKTVKRKPTATQVENEGFKNAILAFLSANMTDSGFTISELTKKVAELNGLESQRVSAIVRQLKEDGLVERTEIKRKAYFSLATPSDDEGDLGEDE